MSQRVVEVSPERFEGWLARFRANNPDGPQRVVSLDRFGHAPLAVVLVRRGGYAVALADGLTLLAHKVGTRHVQSRTAAGGWSQQRFARRRGNQADELVHAVQGHAARVLEGAEPRGLILGGDKALAALVLEDPRLRALVDLPRRELYDLADPRRGVLDAALARARAVRVTIEDDTPRHPVE